MSQICGNPGNLASFTTQVHFDSIIYLWPPFIHFQLSLIILYIFKLSQSGPYPLSSIIWLIFRIDENTRNHLYRIYISTCNDEKEEMQIQNSKQANQNSLLRIFTFIWVIHQLHLSFCLFKHSDNPYFQIPLNTPHTKF